MDFSEETGLLVASHDALTLELISTSGLHENIFNSLVYPKFDNTEKENHIGIVPLQNCITSYKGEMAGDNNMIIENAFQQFDGLNTILTNGVMLSSEYIPTFEYGANDNMSTFMSESQIKVEPSSTKTSKKNNIGHENLRGVQSTTSKPARKRASKKMAIKQLNDDTIIKLANNNPLESLAMDMDVKKGDLIHPFIASTMVKPEKRYRINQIQRTEKMNESVEMLRKLVPGISPKTDKTTVIEITANYVKFLGKKIGSEYDSEFLRKIHI